MSNKREIEPSLDYFELRRRHEEYKNSQRQKDEPGQETAAQGEFDRQEAASAPAEPAMQAGEPDDGKAFPQAQTVLQAEAAPQAQPIPQDVPAEEFEVKDAAYEPEDVTGKKDRPDSLDAQDGPDNGQDVEDAALLDDAMPEDDDQDDEAVAGDNPNPFDSFIHAFKGLRGKLAGRFGRRRQDDEEYEDDEPLEDELPDDEPLGDDGPVDGQRGEAPAAEPGNASASVIAKADEAPQGDVAVEDVSDDVAVGGPAVTGMKADKAEGREMDNEGLSDEDVDVDDGDDEDYDEDYGEDDPGRVSGFKKFLRLFIVRVDDEEKSDDDVPEVDEYEYEIGDDDVRADDGADVAAGRQAPALDVGAPGDEMRWAAPAIRDNEGGPDMSDLNNVKTELTDTLAAGLEGSGMTRRQRRELAQRLAAEKAAAEAEARAAAAEAEAEAARAQAAAAVAVAETAATEADEVVQTASEAVGEAALEADAIEDVSKGIVNIESGKQNYDAVTDEPTREYKAVSKVNLDDLMNDKDLDDKADDDEEEEKKPARRGLFGRRRKDWDDDEDDEDDDDEDDDEEEKDERPRRGLFGRRRKARDEDDDDDDEYEYDEDDEDDEDDDDDEDDRRGRNSRRGRRRYDEDDDDYDDYDDDYDDYDDDDDEGTSFGHVLLGILKGFLTAVMLLLFVVVVLNVLNIFNIVKLDGLAKRLPTRMVSIFLPSEGMKQRINVESNANPAPVAEGVPLVPQPAPQAEPEPVVAQPVEEEPAEPPVEEAPAEAPVEEAPAENNASEAVG